MWRAVGSSVIGSSHEKAGTPCQDASEYYFAYLKSDRALLIGISDGAGSAAAAEIGSSESVQYMLSQIANSGLHIFEIGEAVAISWIVATRNQLQKIAAARSLEIRDLACTLLVAILTEHHSIFIQIGDGAWIAATENAYLPITWPTKGEYVNQATFLTSSNWSDALQFKVITEPLRGVAGFTDGLENLALHFASRSVHRPFFEGKFGALANATDITELRGPLIEYLSSDSLKGRTDDDKTLVLAHRCEPKLLGFDASIS